MATPELDTRNDERKRQDEQIASAPKLPAPHIASGAQPLPVESHLRRQRSRPLAVAGIVENGLVRPLDPQVKLAEHARVIIVASESV